MLDQSSLNIVSITRHLFPTCLMPLTVILLYIKMLKEQKVLGLAQSDDFRIPYAV